MIAYERRARPTPRVGVWSVTKRSAMSVGRRGGGLARRGAGARLPGVFRGGGGGQGDVVVGVRADEHRRRDLADLVGAQDTSPRRQVRVVAAEEPRRQEGRGGGAAVPQD